jgi:Zn-dependent protease
MSKNKSSLRRFFSSFSKVGKSIWTTTKKLSKFGLAGLSFAAYAFLYNWRLALLIMISVGFHESGHIWAMKKAGIKTKGFYFIPFIGGIAIAEAQYSSYKQNVWVAIMGPVWGCLLALVTAGVYYYTKNSLFAIAAIWMAALNLINLVPISPLDGGQIMRSITFSINQTVGLVFLIFSFAISANIMFVLRIREWALIFIVGGIELIFELYLRYKTKNKKQSSWLTVELTGSHCPTPLNWKQIVLSTTSYVVLSSVLMIIILVLRNIPDVNLALYAFIQ